MIEKPGTLKVEFSRGCNLACKFCPISADPAAYADHTFLEPALLQAFLRDYATFQPAPRVELTLRGEPTLNPACEELLGLLRQHLPRAQVSMFTNGVRILKDPSLAVRLLEAGVNILNIDCYNKTYDRFEALARAAAAERPWITVADFRAFSAYQRHPNGHAIKVINLVPDLADARKLVQVRVVHNMAGYSDPAGMLSRFGVAPLVQPLQSKCARPFREFVLYHDGTVPLCCHDWGPVAASVLGHFPTQSVHDIWYGPAHRAVLAKLHAADRAALSPCDRCDYRGGFRLGLLKDPAQ